MPKPNRSMKTVRKRTSSEPLRGVSGMEGRQRMEVETRRGRGEQISRAARRRRCQECTRDGNGDSNSPRILWGERRYRRRLNLLRLESPLCFLDVAAGQSPASKRSACVVASRAEDV